MILLVEDDRIVSDTLAHYLTQAGFAVECTADGRHGLARALTPDVRLVILDLMLPGMNGREICREIRALSRVPIMMLTARTSEDDRVTGLELGADDYVAKPFSPREVVARVQALLRRAGEGATAAAEPLRLGPIAIDTWARQVRVSGQAVPLTPTEFRLVSALASSPGRVFTRDELVGRVLGADFEGTDRTVDVHVTNVRRKLPAGCVLIVTVHGIGYRLASTDDA
ncbi:DNA-binding response regulator [Luteitalea sp. TBR-22]|uniref:response regulator transcription factor n=1 Tax=Luteitalea sp. TBR-22 TaxID=2802971 RepID=UPI001AF045FA|nr:response regulator transcription factor [Luteitalea sp. TBR-22]BCS30876.1 DNA-binding response regulator [Luteitalea sp. TBR-22]